MIVLYKINAYAFVKASISAFILQGCPILKGAHAGLGRTYMYCSVFIIIRNYVR